MSFISEVSQEQWKALVSQTEPQRPAVGKLVRVVSGKHRGQIGRVTWHGINKFSAAWSYCSDAQAQLRELAGRYGFRIRIDTGSESFFIDADKVEIIQE